MGGLATGRSDSGTPTHGGPAMGEDTNTSSGNTLKFLEEKRSLKRAAATKTQDRTLRRRREGDREFFQGLKRAGPPGRAEKRSDLKRKNGAGKKGKRNTCKKVFSLNVSVGSKKAVTDTVQREVRHPFTWEVGGISSYLGKEIVPHFSENDLRSSLGNWLVTD